MTLEDDAALSAFEWLQFLDECPQLDVPAGPRDKNVIVVVLSDHIHLVECNLWTLLLT